MTDEETVAAPLEEASVSLSPPVGAFPFSVTVALETRPPTIVAGVSARTAGQGGVTVNVAVCLVAPTVAVRVAAMLVATGEVLAVKVPEVAFAGILIDAGTRTELLEDVKVTTIPAAGAPADRFTVPIDELPPTTFAGATVSPVRL